MNDYYAAIIVVSIAFTGLRASNILVDRGLDAYTARRIPAALGGVAFLLIILWMDFWPAIALSIVVCTAIIALRLSSRGSLRGVAGVETQPWVEVTFVVAGTASLAIGWGLMHDRWLAFVPIGFLAWGDTASGVVRVLLLRRGNRMRNLPAIGMLIACMLVASLYSPFWIGAGGAVAATVSERFTPRIAGIQDDNWAIVGLSLGVMAVMANL